MWRPRSQIDYLNLESQVATAGLALACPYSGSDEYEASVIAQRRNAGAYRRDHSQAILAASAAAVALVCLLAF
jgi:hypothetical protein